MKVSLLDGKTYEVDAIDIALLTQRTEIDVPHVYSKDIFWWFTTFVKRQDLGLDQKLIEQWNIQFMEEIMDTDTLHDLIMLASKTGQTKLLDVCCQRVADVLRARVSRYVAELLNLPHVEDDENDDEEDGDDEDGDGEGGDDDDNDALPQAPGSGNDDMDNDMPPDLPDDSDCKGPDEDLLSHEDSGEDEDEEMF